MSEEIDKHVLKKYEVQQRLGKGVSAPCPRRPACCRQPLALCCNAAALELDHVSAGCCRAAAHVWQPCTW